MNAALKKTLDAIERMKAQNPYAGIFDEHQAYMLNTARLNSLECAERLILHHIATEACMQEETLIEEAAV